MYRIDAYVVLLVGVLLSGCGGGGGGDKGSPVPAPDLAVTALSAPSAVTAGSTYYVTGTVTNLGNLSSYGASAEVYLSPFSDVERDGSSLDLDVYVGELKPGQKWNFSTLIRVPMNLGDGNYHLGAVTLDPFDPDPRNNVRSQPVAASGGTVCTADAYEADDSSLASKPLGVGDSQQHNHCEGTSDWFRFGATGGQSYGVATYQAGGRPQISVYKSDGTFIASTVDALEPGPAHVTWTAPANATYYVRVFPGSALEGSGADTEYSVTLGDMRPDLYVGRFAVPSTGLPGGSITIDSTVQNVGFADAAASELAVYLSTDDDVTTADTLLGSRPVGALTAGAEQRNNADRFYLPALAAGQTYYIAGIVNPNETVDEFGRNNNRTAVGAITIENPAGCSSDDYEQDDTVAQVQQAPVVPTITVGGGEQVRNHCEDDADWISFAATAGERYAVRVREVGGYTSLWVELYSTDGATFVARSGPSSAAIDWQAPSSGTYYLKVGSDSTGSARGYAVKVDPKLPDLAQTLTEPYSTPSIVAGGVYYYLRDEVRNIGHDPSGPFEVGFYMSSVPSVTNVDTLVGTRAIENLTQASSYGSYDLSYNSRIYIPRDTGPGTYYVAAMADRAAAVTELNETNNTSGSVAINVVAPSCPWDAYEDNDRPDMAKPIADGETQTHNHCDDYVDWMRFTPATGGAYVASDGEILESDGETRVQSQGSGYGGTAWIAEAGKTYYLRDSLYYGNTDSTDYQVTVYACPQDGFEEDDTSAGAKAISKGETQSRNHCEDLKDWASFAATAGTTYSISTSGPEFELYNTDGTSRLAVSSLQGKRQVISWTATASGTYYVQVESSDIDKGTDYTLSLN